MLAGQNLNRDAAFYSTDQKQSFTDVIKYAFLNTCACWTLFSIKLIIEKEIPAQVFFCEFCKILFNTYFIEHLRKKSILVKKTNPS